MAEEIVLNYDLNRNYIQQGLLSEELVIRLRFYTSEDLARKYPVMRSDVILVVDTSGSMDDPFSQGSNQTRRQGVYEAIQQMLKLLSPDDELSLICYDSNAYVDLDHGKGSNGAVIKEKIKEIMKHNGATNFERAFDAAKVLAKKGENPNKKIIFLTDGNSTEGKLSNAHKTNGELAQKGVTVDCMGVGGDFNFSEMQKFSAPSNGRTELLKAPSDAVALFGELLKGAQSTFINNAVLRIAIPKGYRDVELYEFTPEIRYFSDLQPDRDGSINYAINLQSMTQTNEYQYLIRLKADMPKATNCSLMKVRIDYDVPVLKLRGQKLESDVIINLSDSPGQDIRDYQLDVDLAEASLIKLDNELNIEAQKKDWKKVGALLLKMKNIAAKIKNTQKASEFQRRLEMLERNGCLTQEEINDLSNSSSVSSRLRRGERQTKPSF